MGAWREKPTSWPIGMPSPDSDGWHGWARHWVAAHICPLWLSQACVEHRVRLADAARLGWRLRAAEAAALERSTVEGGALRQSLRDAGLSEEVAAEILTGVEADVERRRRTLEELGAVGQHL